MLRITIMLVALLLATTGGHAQTPVLEQVEQNVGDVGPLGVSLRSLSVDLRQPTGFGGVYRHPSYPDRLIRADGGLYAVFPTSFYVFNRRGERRAAIPAGTEFYIGPPPFLDDPLATDSDAEDVINEATPGRVITAQEQYVYGARLHPVTVRRRPSAGPAPVDASAASEQTPVASTIATDPNYREARLRELMDEAVRRKTTPPPVEIVNDHAARGGPSSSESPDSN